MKNIKFFLIFIFLGTILNASGLNVYIGVDGWRHDTGIEDSGDPGANIGLEYLFNVHRKLDLGLGAEWKSPMDGFHNNHDFSPIFAFAVGKFFFTESFYMLGRLGYSYNNYDDTPADDGPYGGIGFGYKWNKFYGELAYEIFDINNNGGLFNNGTMQMVGIKMGYNF